MKLGLLLNTKINTDLVGLISTWPMEEAYHLLKTLDKVKKAQQNFQDLRMVLIGKYTKRNENGELVKNEDGSQYVLENIEAFNKEYEDLVNIDVKITLPASVLSSLKEENKSTP